MVRHLPFVILWLFFSVPSHADWLGDLVDRSRSEGIEINNAEDLMRFVDRSPESIVGQPGESQRIGDWDVVGLPEVYSAIQSQSGKKIQINVFKKAYFFKPASTSQDARKRDLASINKAKQIGGINSVGRFEFRSETSFSKLSAKDRSSGGRIQSTSEANLGFYTYYRRPINPEMQVKFMAGGVHQAFQAPADQSLRNSADIYYRISGGIDWDLDKLFAVTGYMGVRQLPYLNTLDGEQLTVVSATQPIFGASMMLKLEDWTGKDIRAEVITELFNNSVDGDIDASSGVLQSLELLLRQRKVIQPNGVSLVQYLISADRDYDSRNG